MIYTNMKVFKNSKTLFLFVFFFTSMIIFSQGKDKFVVVLDAGHGGKDYGAVYGEFIEKNIILKVVLKIGEILAQDP